MAALPETIGRIHGHLLSPGALFMLILAILQNLGKVGEPEQQKSYTAAFWLDQSGLILMCALMFIRAMTGWSGGALDYVISGFAGIGHALLAIGLIWILFDVRKALIKVQKSSEPSPYEWEHRGR